MINVGLMERDSFCILKPVRGKKLPLKIDEKSSSAEIKLSAINKHASHDQNFCALEEYVLLYPDGKEVIKLPGLPSDDPENDKEFSLLEYKTELGKPYSQINFYLCTVTNFEESDSTELPCTANSNHSIAPLTSTDNILVGPMKNASNYSMNSHSAIAAINSNKQTEIPDYYPTEKYYFNDDSRPR